MATTPTPAPSAAPAAAHGDSPWAPLAARTFRILWIAQFASNLGTWVQTVGAQWLLLGHGPAWVALVQTASSLPVFLLALPSGVLADLTDRRRLLLTAQLGMSVIAGALALLTLLGHTTPALLLALTFLLGCGAALTGPAWQAIQPELVPRAQLKQASALGAVNLNIARALGPALGGVLVATAGTGWTFLLNAVSFLFIAAALLLWKRPAQTPVDDSERERALAAVRAATRYLRSAPGVRRILLRAALFVPAASALWSLLPSLAAERLHLSSGNYGLLLGAVGIGAVAGAILLPRISRRVGGSTVLLGSGVAFAAATATTPLCGSGVLAALPLLVSGAAWIGAMSTLNSAMQLLLPPWVRARGLAFYLVVFMGGQAFGALAWGLLAAHTSLTAALLTAGGLLLAGTATLRWLPLRDNADFDRTLSSTWPDPVLALEPRPADGPVQIMIDYRVAAADQAAFTEAMRLVELSRRRTGAISWGLFQDTTEADRFTETFLVSSWSEHLAQHHTRYTGHDHDIEEAARTFTTQPPEVRHGLPPQTELPPAGGVPATE